MFRNLLAGAVTVGLLLGATSAAQAQCPEVGKAPQTLSVTEGFVPDPIRRNVLAGGDIDLSACGLVRRVGYVTRLPDFVINYKTHGPRSKADLTFRIDSQTDTVLLINDPNGQWHYNDDGGNRLNAKITFKRAMPGRYDVWVGT